MHTVLTNMACIFYYIGKYSDHAMGVKGVMIRRKMHEKSDNTRYCQGNGVES